jgi:transcriptional regulator with XRE-family HTH domain
MNIGAAIKARRKAHGLTLAELAQITGVGRSAIVLVEKDRGSVRTLNAVAGPLNFRPSGIGAGSTLAKQLINARMNRGLTQAALAFKAKLSIPTIRSLERGGGSIRALNAVLNVLAPGARANPVYRAHYQILDDVRLTPPDFMAEIVSFFGAITIDVAGSTNSFVEAKRVILEKEDGLKTRWSGDLAWCNPPYSNLSRWLHRCADAWDGQEVQSILGLFPARTETVAFRTRLVGVADIVLLPRRLRLYDEDRVRLAPSPFPLMLCAWGVERSVIEAYVASTGSTPIWASR